MHSPLLRVQTPMGECSAGKDSALQLLGEVCLQPVRSGDSAAGGAQAEHASEAGVKAEPEVCCLTRNTYIMQQKPTEAPTRCKYMGRISTA